MEESKTADEEQRVELYDHIYLTCKRADNITVVNGEERPDLSRPLYINQFRQEFFDVENLALRYYSLREGLNGMHCENTLGKYLLGVLMWPIIYHSKVPYVFQTPF